MRGEQILHDPGTLRRGIEGDLPVIVRGGIEEDTAVEEDIKVSTIHYQ